LDVDPRALESRLLPVGAEEREVVLERVFVVPRLTREVCARIPAFIPTPALPLVDVTFVPSEGAEAELLPPPAVDATAPPKLDELVLLPPRPGVEEEDPLPLDPLPPEDPEFD
jgi:hypothetical protein